MAVYLIFEVRNPMNMKLHIIQILIPLNFYLMKNVAVQITIMLLLAIKKQWGLCVYE